MFYTPQLIFFVLAFVLNLFLGLLVYRRHAKNLVNRLFLFLILSVLFWLLFNFLSDLQWLTLLWNRLTYVGSTLIAVTLVYFAYLFPDNKAHIGIIKHTLIIVPAVAVIFATVFTGLVVSDIKFESWGTDILPGPLGLFYPLYFLIYSIWALVILWRKYRINRGIQRNQLRYMFLGLLLSLLAGFYTNSISYLFIGDYRLAKYGPHTTLLLTLFTTYAIVAHRLFDIRVIIKRTVIYTGLLAFVLGAYALVIFVTVSLFGASSTTAFSAQRMVPNILAALAIAAGFDPLRRWLTVKTDRWLYKGEYTPEEVLRNLSETLTNVINLEEAVRAMIRLMVKAMRLDRGIAFLVQKGEHEGEFELKQAIAVGPKVAKKQQELTEHEPLIDYFESVRVSEETPGVVVVEELMRQLDEGSISHERAKLTADLIKRARDLAGAVVMPLYITRQQAVPTAPGQPTKYQEIPTFIGVLVLGEKKSGDAFTDQDLNLLEIVSRQTAAAVEKARIYEEDQLKSEFVSIASHELLTPTAAMKGYLSMVLDEGMGKVDKQARGFLEKVYSESERLGSLVKDLLNVSRIERGKILVRPEPIELVPAIEQVVEELMIRAKERNLKLIFEKPKKNLPKVMADSEKLTQVMMNIIGNGLKYTAEGSVTISLAEQGNMVSVITRDTGIGMKPEDLDHLFGKFFRASNADDTGQTGTGLGLFITKSIIELMGGTITVESQVGKGSAFTFTLPIAK